MLELNDQNFEEEIKKAEKPVLIDFWASWCQPCFILGPILEKVAEDYKDRLILAKVNLDGASNLAQKYQVDRIPMVALFNQGKPVGAFVGVMPEKAVKEIVDKMLEDAKSKEEGESEEDKSSSSPFATAREGKEDIEKIIQFYQEYAKTNGFKLNPSREVVERLIKGLLENEKKYGARYCPCRRVTGNKEEDKGKICPCQWHREEIERDGHCFCGLFVRE